MQHNVNFRAKQAVIRRKCLEKLKAMLVALEYPETNISIEFMVEKWLPSIFDHHLKHKFEGDAEVSMRRSLLKEFIDFVLTKWRIHNEPTDCIVRALINPEENYTDTRIASNAIQLINAIPKTPFESAKPSSPFSSKD